MVERTSPDADGRVVLLTGGTSGVGQRAARRLSERGSTVVVTGRSRRRGERLVAETTDETPGTVVFEQVDFARQSAVRDLAARFRTRYERLDVLAHNAGVSRRSRHETPDGIEETFAVNHLAPYLLTHELSDLLVRSAPARVVVTSSGVHRRGTLDFDDLEFEAGYDALDAYARSKLANVAFTVELADRLEGTGVTANAFHPGFIPGSRLYRDTAPWLRAVMAVLSAVPFVGDTAAEGGRRLTYLATDPGLADVTGEYFDGYEPVEPAPAALDAETRERLWDVSAEQVGVDADWPDV